jgi:hypothetical protein
MGVPETKSESRRRAKDSHDPSEAWADVKGGQEPRSPMMVAWSGGRAEMTKRASRRPVLQQSRCLKEQNLKGIEVIEGHVEAQVPLLRSESSSLSTEAHWHKANVRLPSHVFSIVLEIDFFPAAGLLCRASICLAFIFCGV